MNGSHTRRPWWRASPTRVRLIAGFTAPIIIFAAAALLSMRNMERLVAATDTIRRLQGGLEAALHMQNLARQQDAALADLSLRDDLAKIERVDAASPQMRRLRLELADVVDTDAERQLLWEARRIERRAYALFHTRFVPAVMENDAASSQALRDESSRLLEEIVHQPAPRAQPPGPHRRSRQKRR